MPVFNGSKNIYQYELSDILAENVKNWVQYGLLELGAYTVSKLNLPTSGYCTLKRVYDDRFGGAGRVYEGMGPSWVWQSGVTTNLSGAYPIFRVSGVYVNNSFYPTSTVGSYSHKIDYRNGRVIFDSSISKTDEVKCEYVYNNCDVVLTDSTKWRTIEQEYDKRYNNIDSLSPSGMASVLKANRIWLPCIGIDVDDIDTRGLQLGGGHIADCIVHYNILSDSPYFCVRISDTLNNQRDHTINLYDINKAPFAFNFDGTLSSSAKTYTELADRANSYFWTYGAITFSALSNMESDSSLFIRRVSHNFEVPRYLSTY